MTPHEKARAWRKAMKLTRPALARRIGYSVRAILNMERGSTSQGRPTDAAAWTRYRMACAGLAAGQEGFDWQPVAFVPLQAPPPSQP